MFILRRRGPAPSLIQRYRRDRTALVFYIASMGVLFASFGLALAATVRFRGDFPLSLPGVFYANTVAVLLASYTYWRAERCVAAANPPRALSWLWLTAMLAALFVAGQAMGFVQLAKLNVHLTNNVYGSFLYVLAGLHALHLFGALIVLGILVVRTAQARIHPLNLRLLGIFWHSLGILWLLMLVFLYAIYG